MKRIALMMLVITFAAAGIVLAQQAQYGNAEESVMFEDIQENTIVNDEGYGVDEEYMEAEALEEPPHENFEDSQNVNTPMNPDINAPQIP